MRKVGLRIYNENCATIKLKDRRRYLKTNTFLKKVSEAGHNLVAEIYDNRKPFIKA